MTVGSFEADMVRSTIMRRSIWARAAMMRKRNSPPAVVVPNRFCEETECNAAFAEVVDGVDDMADGSSEAVEFPDDEDITVVVAEVVQAFGELGTLCLGAGFVVGEDADRSGLTECVLLQFGVLFEGGDAGVSDDAHSLGPSDLLLCCGMVRLFMSWWSTSGLQWV